MNDDCLGPARFEVQDAEGCKTAVVTQELEQVGVDDATRDEEDSTVLLGLIMEEFLAEGLTHEGLQALPLHFQEWVKVLSTHDISSRGKLAVEQLGSLVEDFTKEDGIQAICGVGLYAHPLDKAVVELERTGCVGVQRRWREIAAVFVLTPMVVVESTQA